VVAYKAAPLYRTLVENMFAVSVRVVSATWDQGALVMQLGTCTVVARYQSSTRK